MLKDLIDALKAATIEQGTTIFEHSAEEIGLMVMENYPDVLAALQPVPVIRGDWHGYDRMVDGKFQAGYLLDRDQEPDLREVAVFNCRDIAATVGRLMAGYRISSGHRVTEADIDAAMTRAGGWTKATLAGWGVPWPPPKGWKKALIEASRS